MVAADRDERSVGAEWRTKFGARWAVLTSMATACSDRGAGIPPGLPERLRQIRTKIASGRFSPCEVGCALERAEGQLVSAGSPLGAEFLRPWFDLLGQAMEGRIDPRRISEIPALASVADECSFLAPRSGEAVTPSAE